MSRFIEIGDNLVNVDTIARAYNQNGKTKIIYKDGTCETSPYLCDLYQFEGKNEIIQVIPVKTPTIAIYRDDIDGKIYVADIFYLGLTEAGEIRPLELQDGYYSFADDVSNFIRLEEKRFRRMEGI